MPLSENFYQLVYVDPRTNKVVDAGLPVPKAELLDLQDDITVHNLIARYDEDGAWDDARPEIRVVPVLPAQKVWQDFRDRHDRVAEQVNALGLLPGINR